MKKAIIVLQKAPVPGNVKTRLAARIGENEALRVYQFLVDHTHRQLAGIASAIYVYFSGEPDLTYLKLPNYYVRTQKHGNLGQRMHAAFAEVFASGHDQVLIVGTDCYELQPNIILDAFDVLASKDVAIGPAKDGGYYLLGMNKLTPELFNGITWSTDTVYMDTMAIVTSLGLDVHTLPLLSDVDRFEDLGELANFLGVREKNLSD